MNYRFTDIKNFVAASSCRTLTEASHKLEISQPALTESVKRLEVDHGEVLFYRSRTGIRLTPAGKSFLIRARDLMQAFSDLSVRPTGVAVFGDRTIRLGCHPTVAQYTLPKALKNLSSKAADYKVEIRHDLSRNIQALVSQGDLDLGLVVNPVRVPDLVIQKIATDEVMVWTSKNTDKKTFICNTALFQTQSILRKLKIKPTRLIHTESLELIAQMTSEGVGLGILPKRAVDLSHCLLTPLKDTPIFRDTLSIVFRPEFSKNLQGKLLIDSIRSVFEGLEIH